ncbi:hypothetical protein NMK34_19305 [Micromonospora sp. BRA006-A]|uniref:hypothetical protein n=1 Tax=Micromonospora TaxID=1873 RepID=UPI001B364318|nr:MULTISPECIES: hypothetical protein [unclassified Micromonospora]MBQ1059173.1 hypothetical protein [Micromonospora sp. C41]MDW3848763.1 hypothetical protein [Micromonospora sp. BRA006-A]
MSLIWATRGRVWGFRFLLTGGFPDPLPEYEAAFAGAGDAPEICHAVGDRVALRIADPLGRQDQSGRLIPHEFVICGPQAAEIRSVADGLALVWPQVAGEFERVWELPRPPV